ncbi:MAG: hypothetical protein EBT92_08925 [Planctomycetes bacterium]|nr:hypothetical protein [Planctomycetota bacterium]NBY02926.1 hypothetical protein [Planctomycetota bacterium]
MTSNSIFIVFPKILKQQNHVSRSGKFNLLRQRGIFWCWELIVIALPSLWNLRYMNIYNAFFNFSNKAGINE